MTSRYYLHQGALRVIRYNRVGNSDHDLMSVVKIINTSITHRLRWNQISLLTGEDMGVFSPLGALWMILFHVFGDSELHIQ